MNDAALTIADQPQWMTPQTMNEAMKFAEIVASSDMVPKSHFRKPGNVLVCMQVASSFDVPLLTALQNVAVINGKPSIYGDMALALVRRRADCVSVNETFDESTMTARCEVIRRGQDDPIVRSFSEEDAKKAGLWGKSGPWQQYPRRMLQMRARGFALRDSFPDALMGLITAEEASDYPTAPRPSPRRAEVVEQHRQRAATPAVQEAVDKFGGEVIDGKVEKPVEPSDAAKRLMSVAKANGYKRSDIPGLSREVLGRIPSERDRLTDDDMAKLADEIELRGPKEEAQNYDEVPF